MLDDVNMNNGKTNLTNEESKIVELSKENQELKSALDELGCFFSELTTESRLGSDMVSQNIHTSFAKDIDHALKNPLEISYNMFQQTGSMIQTLIDDATTAYLKSNKPLIKKAVKAYGSSLIYTIVLNEDSVTNRAKLLTYVNEYRNTQVSKNFNVMFNFLPIELESYIREKHEVVC